VETTASGVTERRYYHDKDEAATRLVFASGASIDASMRPTRLEDVYRHAISKELGQ
jgi:hypothetical protein